MVRYAAAASTTGSVVLHGISPARSDIVATPDPGMARTLEGLLLAEELIAGFVARAVEIAESGAKQSAQSSAKVSSSRTKLIAAVEADRVDAASEDYAHPGCRCTVM